MTHEYLEVSPNIQMPKHNARSSISDRLARRAYQVDPERTSLIEKILEESSSVALNDGTNQQNARQALEDHSNLFDLIDRLKQVESSCNPKLPSRDENSWANFFTWIDANTTDKLTHSLSVSEQAPSCGCAKNEFALITRKTIKKGESIFQIDRHLMLTTENLDSKLSEFIKKDSIASTMQNVVLVLNLLNEFSKKEKSFWAPYLTILPNKILPILSMDKDKLKQLVASAHLIEALKMIRAIARQYSYFYDRLRRANLALSKDFTFQYYAWGVSIVCSRQNEIPPLDRKSASLSSIVHALIPILDMCNHNKESNQATFENNESRLIAAKDLGQGEEVTINYGCRSSGEFYIHNGFVPNEVPHDIVPLTIALNKQDPVFEAKKTNLLRTLNMPTFGRFRLTRNDYESRHKRDPHLTMFLIVYFLSKEELDFILNNDNPVGIADEVYEYVQYNECSPENSTNTVDINSRNNDNLNLKDADEVSKMKKRVASCIKEYLSRRALIGIALIDRTLKESEQLDNDTTMLLEHEKRLYQTYLINCSAE